MRLRSNPLKILLLSFLFFVPRDQQAIAQVKGLEGRYLIKNTKTDAFEKKVLRLRRFKETDKYKKLSICLNFKMETGYVIEEKFWKVELNAEQGFGAKTFGYSGQVLTWVWESKDKFRVFSGTSFREFHIHWLPGNIILLKKMHSRSPSFQRPFKHNLSSH